MRLDETRMNTCMSTYNYTARRSHLPFLLLCDEPMLCTSPACTFLSLLGLSGILRGMQPWELQETWRSTSTSQLKL